MLSFLVHNFTNLEDNIKVHFTDDTYMAINIIFTIPFSETKNKMKNV